MNKRPKRYWAIRTDKDNMDLLFSELRAGRLRQGWGYDAAQDLNVIWSEIEHAGQWKSRLAAWQRDALPNLRMLGKGQDSIAVGDVILLPNLPDSQSFCIAEVSGAYYFEMLKLTKQQDVNSLGADYGHVLPVRLVTPNGINRHHTAVHADLRSTMRTPMRMWNVDDYGKRIEELVEQAARGKDLSSPASEAERLDAAVDRSLDAAVELVRHSLLDELTTKFQGAEWERPVAEALRRLYPGSEVQRTAGSHEHGADIVVYIPNYFGDEEPWLILIQIKNSNDEIGPEVLKQIDEASNYYGEQGEVLCAVVATTAARGSTEFEAQQKSFDRAVQRSTTKSKVYLLDREKLSNLLVEAFLSYHFPAARRPDSTLT